MHARSVSVRLKPFIAPGGMEALAVSFWDEKADAESSNHANYPEVQKALMSVLAGPPQVRIYEVSNSTFHKIAVPALA